jgi:hypothetical protein
LLIKEIIVVISIFYFFKSFLTVVDLDQRLLLLVIMPFIPFLPISIWCVINRSARAQIFNHLQKLLGVMAGPDDQLVREVKKRQDELEKTGAGLERPRNLGVDK